MHIHRLDKLSLAILPTHYYFLCKVKKVCEPLWKQLGSLESFLLRKRLRTQVLDRPIYVTGLARSGTTITLELLSKHRDAATHRYRDMAQPYLPYFWTWLTDRLPLPKEVPTERVHKDGIFVTRDSPEAVEESFWNRFFPKLYDETHSAILGAETRNTVFESYYRASIGKLLLAYRRSRYVSKANYNLTRLAYLVRLCPGARFVVMVRDPASHFVSWVKQHELFLQTQQEDPRWFDAIRMAGHAEFGLDNRFINPDNTTLIREIRAAWDAGNRATAFGLYWSALYGHVLNQVEQDPLVRAATLFVRYEDLCTTPRETINRIIAHCQLDANSFQEMRDVYEKKLTAPQYYQAKLDEKDLTALRETTKEVAQKFSY